MKKEISTNKEFVFNESLYSDIKQLLQNGRQKVYQVMASTMTEVYWNIGKMISEEIGDRATYGSFIMQNLSERLTNEFGKGFSFRNVHYMLDVYKCFPILHTACAKLSWSHLRTLSKVERTDIRDFYVKECIDGNWSVRQLDRQINSFFCQRLLVSKEKEAVRGEIHQLENDLSPVDIVKDPYVLEFLGLSENKKFLESEMEKALIENLEKFLLELGKGFSFVGRQQRITDDNEHWYIDLVFYNYILKCFVLIDLKTGKLTHKDIGQMDFYVRYYDGEIKRTDDNPTIGIILCADKSTVVAKYSVLKENKQLFASKYMLYLPTEEELQKELLREKQLIEEESILKRLEEQKK